MDRFAEYLNLTSTFRMVQLLREGVVANLTIIILELCINRRTLPESGHVNLVHTMLFSKSINFIFFE